MVADARTGTVQDEHPVRTECGAHPVRDDDQCARPGRERALGPRRRDRIKMAGRLVKDGEPGGREVRPGQRDELALPCRDRVAGLRSA